MPTLLELETEVRNLLDEPTAAQWTQSALRTWLNEANRDIARVTRHYKSTDTVTMVSGTAEYTMDANIIAIEQAWYDDGSRQLPLAPRHYENMDHVWGDQQNYQGAFPAFYTTWGYSPQLKLRLYPVPTSNTHTVKLLTVIYPTAMPLTGSDGTAVDVPGAWYDALADYCMFRALQRDRDPRWQEYRQLYLEKRDDMLMLSDYDNVNREVVADPNVGYLPRWLVEFDY